MNNWRTMHGRAGLAGKTRTILGGTVTREAFYSAVRQQACDEAGVPSGKEVGVPTEGLAVFGASLPRITRETEQGDPLAATG